MGFDFRKTIKILLRLALCWGWFGWTTQATWAAIPSDSALFKPDPLQQWYTLETAHFHIHYQKLHFEFAQRMAAVAEKVYSQQTLELDWQPHAKTQVVINDSFDGSNGGATVFPYNQFFIFMTPPTDGELLDNSPWMELVFSHEFAHILHLDQAAGAQSALRIVFGRFFLFFPQVFSPSWLSEGFAVFEETDQQRNVGRGQSALYAAMMRAELINGFRSFSELSYQGSWGTDWPGSQTYFYGYYFFEFLSAQYGKQKTFEYLRNWNDNVVPWRMQSRAQEVFGLSAEGLWSEYLQYLETKLTKSLATLPEPNSSAIVDNGRVNASPRWLSDENFYYYREDGRHHPALQHIDQHGKESKVADIEQFIQLEVHPEAGVLLSRYAVCDNINVYADLYRLNSDGSWKRITRCGRYPRMAWSTTGKRIAAVHVERGINQIAILDQEGILLQLLAPLEIGAVIGELGWSPDDTQLVASVYRQKSGWNLERLNLRSGQWTALTRNVYLEQRPRFSADGMHVYFLSDENDVWNVRRMSLASGRVETVTRTQTAILDYSLNRQEDQVRVAEYSAQGVMIRQQEVKSWADYYAGLWLQRPELASIANRADFDPVQYDQVSDYSPFPSLLPTSWFAMFYADSDDNRLLQFYLSGHDVLDFHAWELAPAYFLEQEKLGGSASYLAFHRLLLFAERDYDTIRTKGNGLLGAWYQETRWQALWMQPFNSFDGSFEVDAGVGQETIDRIIEDFGRFDQFNDNFAGIAFSWSNYEFYVHSVSPEDGRRIRLQYELYNAFGGGFHKGAASSLDWQEYISVFDNQVLALRAVFGKADAEAKPFQLGNELDEMQTLGAEIGFGRTGYTLRGYTDHHPQLAGNNLRLFSAEYRLPLLEVFDGFTSLPLGVGKIGLTAFVDHGAAWEEGAKRDYYTGVGLELTPELLIGYSTFKLNSTLGYSKGLDSELGESVIYLQLGLNF